MSGSSWIANSGHRWALGWAATLQLQWSAGEPFKGVGQSTPIGWSDQDGPSGSKAARQRIFWHRVPRCWDRVLSWSRCETSDALWLSSMVQKWRFHLTSLWLSWTYQINRCRNHSLDTRIGWHGVGLSHCGRSVTVTIWGWRWMISPSSFHASGISGLWESSLATASWIWRD